MGLLLLRYGVLVPFRAFPGVVDDGDHAGIELGVVLDGVEPDLVLIDTTTIMAAAEAYLLITRFTDWDLDACQDWLAITGTHLARVTEENS